MGKRYQIIKDNSFVQFRLDNLGEGVIRGGVAAYQGTFFYDPNNVASTSATVRFDTEAFTTLHVKRDEVLQSAQFLNSAEFPHIWFQSTKAVPKGDGFDLVGNLIIKDIVKEVTVTCKTPQMMPKSGPEKYDRVFVRGEMTFNRMDFDLGKEGPWNTPMGNGKLMGDDVSIEFHFHLYSWTIDHLKDRFAKTKEGNPHPAGLVYQAAVEKGTKGGMKKYNELRKADKNSVGPSTLGDAAWMLMNDGHPGVAVDLFENGLKEDPRHMANVMRIGDAYVGAGKHEEAIKHFTMLSSQFPKNTHWPELLKLLDGKLMTKSSQ